MCTSCRDGRRRRRHHPPHLIRKLINFCCNLLEKNLHQLSGFPSRQLVQKSRLGWSPSCGWRRIFSWQIETLSPPSRRRGRHLEAAAAQRSSFLSAKWWQWVGHNQPLQPSAEGLWRPQGPLLQINCWLCSAQPIKDSDSGVSECDLCEQPMYVVYPLAGWLSPLVAAHPL